MKKLSNDEARAGSMTIEEAGTATYWRALQIEGTMTGLMCRQSASYEEWESMFKAMTETRPWMHLPSEDAPFGDLYKWLGAKFRVGDQPMTRKHLVAIVDAYHPGTGRQAVSQFEKDLDQPYVAVGKHGGARTKQRDPDHLDSQRGVRGTTGADYLMARLAHIGVNCQEEIGPDKQFKSAAEAARHYGIVQPRTRYEVSPGVNEEICARRLVEVLGAEKFQRVCSYAHQHIDNL